LGCRGEILIRDLKSSRAKYYLGFVAIKQIYPAKIPDLNRLDNFPRCTPALLSEEYYANAIGKLCAVPSSKQQAFPAALHELNRRRGTEDV
jgi:hypothetical protein